MKSVLPRHKVSLVSDCGLKTREISSVSVGQLPVTYAHQDDYYIFGLMEKGQATYELDFSQRTIYPGQLLLIQPGQVHKFGSSQFYEGFALIVDSSYVDKCYTCLFQDVAFSGIEVDVPSECQLELRMLFDLIRKYIPLSESEADKRETYQRIARSLAEAFVGLVAACATSALSLSDRKENRRLEIVRTLNQLLNEHIAINRSPSFYAGLMHISPVYLNEVINDICGVSTSQYIRNMFILNAKRLLAYTSLSVKEIAAQLGVDDSAYLSRIFTSAVGVSPVKFRQNLK